jgi:hypothetical protein
MGVTTIPVMARSTPADFNDAFATTRKEDCDALVVLPRFSNMQRLVQLADASCRCSRVIPLDWREIAARSIMMGGLKDDQAQLFYELSPAPPQIS